MDKKPITLLDMNEKPSKQQILNILRSPRIIANAYQVKPAIEEISNDMLKLGTGYRDKVPKTLFILTNQPQDISVEKEIKKLSEKNIKIVAIGLGSKISPSDLVMLTGGKPDLVQVLTKEDDVDKEKINTFLNPSKFANMNRIHIQIRWILYRKRSPVFK